MTTPWARYQTATPEAIVCWRSGELIRVATGNNVNDAAIGEFNFTTGEVSLWVPRTYRGTPMPPYRLELGRRQGAQPVIIQLHPLAMVHLLATGQVSRQHLLHGMLTIGSAGALSYSMPATPPCSLLDMLGVQNAALSFCTTYDLCVK